MPIQGFPIGIHDDPDYEKRSVQLTSGDRLYLFSDGIVEARNSKEEQFGMEHIVKELTKSTSESFERVSPSLIYAVQQWQNSFSSQDDISFLSVEIQ